MISTTLSPSQLADELREIAEDDDLLWGGPRLAIENELCDRRNLGWSVKSEVECGLAVFSSLGNSDGTIRLTVRGGLQIALGMLAIHHQTGMPSEDERQLGDALEALSQDEDALTVGVAAVEAELREWRESGLQMGPRGNGFVIKTADGATSSVIRFGPEVGVRVALKAIATSLDGSGSLNGDLLAELAEVSS